jgi:hypothetical protein
LSKRIDAAQRRSLFLHPGTKQSYEVIDVKLPVAGARAEWSILAPGRVRIDVLDLPADDALDGKVVTIHTDLDDMATIEVPIHVVP